MRLFLIVVSTILFLMVVVNLFVEAVIFIAEDEHIVDQVKINEVFEGARFLKVRDRMLKQNYTLLVGDGESGVKNFIEHQSNIQTLDGREVVVKRYQAASSEKRELLKRVKETRFYIELALGLDRKSRTEVFFVNGGEEVPLNEIRFIREKYPRDHIVVVSERDREVTPPPRRSRASGRSSSPG